jgi:hypothetical protein
LIAKFGWNSIFFIMVALGIVTIVLARRFFPVAVQSAKQVHAGFDHGGTMLLAGTLAAYALAMTMGRGHFGTINMALLGAALLGLVAFVFFELKVSSPLVDISGCIPLTYVNRFPI